MQRKWNDSLPILNWGVNKEDIFHLDFMMSTRFEVLTQFIQRTKDCCIGIPIMPIIPRPRVLTVI